MVVEIVGYRQYKRISQSVKSHREIFCFFFQMFYYTTRFWMSLTLIPTHILRSRNIITPGGLRSGDILITNGRITEVLPYRTADGTLAIEDVGELVVMPGLVDSHVHINEPGRTEWEGFATATRAAAAGGITTLVDMPLNSSPVTTTLEAFRSKLNATSGELTVDCGFYGGVVPGNTSHLAGLIDAGVLGMKAFLIDSGIDEFRNAGEADLREAMPIIANSGLPLLVHCELHPHTETASEYAGGKSYLSYLSSRPRRWELDAITLMIRLCREYKCAVHIVHLASADAVPALQAARAEGLKLTVETCPHYLFFAAEDVADGNTLLKCAPPIRERENCQRLWLALRDGIIDLVVSDHSPSPPAMKSLESGDFKKAWGGISSLQFGLPVMWSAARERGFALTDISEWMSRKPAALAGLGETKGSIASGFDADLVVFDPDASFDVTPSMIHHRHKITPYERHTLVGVVTATYLRGEKVYANGAFIGPPRGRPILSAQAMLKI